MRILFLFSFCTVLHTLSIAQLKWHVKKDSSDLTFKGTKLNPYSQQFDSTGSWTLTGYLDNYIAHYSDTANVNGFCKFPTISPRTDQFGLNIVQLTAKYQSNSFRSTTTLFAGDCPKAAWSMDFNFVQEANLGFRLQKRLWFDMGFFRTHIGLESIQPRENMTMSLATTSYFEPYFLSGAKLTFDLTKNWIMQLNAFNSFNSFTETNRNKALGLSTAYSSNHIYLVYSTLISNETAINSNWRWYNNFCMSYNSKKLILGAEANLGIQSKNMGLSHVYSGLLAAKYRFTPKIASYFRSELFIDPDEVLTGPVYNENHALVGMEIAGLTYGWEYKPIPNSYVRLETRVLSNFNEHIFSYNSAPSKIRSEFSLGMGVWF